LAHGDGFQREMTPSASREGLQGDAARLQKLQFYPGELQANAKARESRCTSVDAQSAPVAAR